MEDRSCIAAQEAMVFGDSVDRSSFANLGSWARSGCQRFFAFLLERAMLIL